MIQYSLRKKPFQLLIMLYLFLPILFTLLYRLPISTTTTLSITDAWFLSSSAISVTGLSTVPMSDLSLFGQFLLLLEIQIGGIGIMALFVTSFSLFRNASTFQTRTLMSIDQQQRNTNTIQSLLSFVLYFSLSVELIGWFFLSPFIQTYDPTIDHIWFKTLFHSVASYTNAGFTLLGNDLSSFQNTPLFLLPTTVLIMFGVIGFTVTHELFQGKRKLSLSTKTNLFVHPILWLGGGIVIFLLEKTKRLQDLPIHDQVMNAWFLSITSRSGGLSTLDIHSLSLSTLIVIMALMFIGGSTSSCGGGIRTTTLAVVSARFFATLTGKKEATLFNRSLYSHDVHKAHALVVFFASLFMCTTFLLSIFEPFSLKNLAFEALSAATTTGLSTGITSTLTTPSKFILSFVMLIGRIGLFSLVFSLVNPKTEALTFSKESILTN